MTQKIKNEISKPDTTLEEFEYLYDLLVTGVISDTNKFPMESEIELSVT